MVYEKKECPRGYIGQEPEGVEPSTIPKSSFCVGGRGPEDWQEHSIFKNKGNEESIDDNKPENGFGGLGI